MKPRMISVIVALVLAGCAPAAPVQPTQDINVVRTTVAHTVVAEITLTAAAFTATPAPPTETPTLAATATASAPVVVDATSIALGTPSIPCDSLTFDPGTVDVNIPDLTQMTPAQEFVKTWKVRNNGTCAWGDGYGLIYAYGEKMGGVPQKLGTVVEVGQEVEISISFKAPTKIGEYVSAWQMSNGRGAPFGKAVYVKIIVK